MPEMNDTCLHEIARALCATKHGDWRYDPGNPKHDKWFERAKVFARHASLSCEYFEHSDGAGSHPAQPTDRPSSKSVRIVGSFRLTPSPARDLRTPALEETQT